MKTKLERIKAHGIDLLGIFPSAVEQDPVKLCKRLRRLEFAASQIALSMCGGRDDYDALDAEFDAILSKVDKLLGNVFPNERVPTFINRDPRGYALKIQSDWMDNARSRLHRDWGGYGIIAPEITDDH